MENVYENELAENDEEDHPVPVVHFSGPRPIRGCLGTPGSRLKTKTNSTHSVRLLSPSPSPPPTLSPRGLLQRRPSRSPSPTADSGSVVSPSHSAVTATPTSLDQPACRQPLANNNSSSVNAEDAVPLVTTPKKPKVDFVRFDSTEIHYTDHDEVRTKISDEIKR